MLVGGLAVAGLAALPQKPVLADPADRRRPPVHDRIEALQRQHNVKIGVYAVDLESGRTVSHLDGESFAMCSTFKGYAAARVLQMVQNGELTLDRQVFVDPEQAALPNSPRTAPNAGGQMTLADLCAAAVQVSDNAAGNLLLQTIGGPSAITDFARSIGDDRTRLDRWEIELNTAIPGDPRDTSTPRALGGGYRSLLTRRRAGPAAAPAARGLDAGQRDIEHAGRPARRLDHRGQDGQRRLRQHQRRRYRVRAPGSTAAACDHDALAGRRPEGGEQPPADRRIHQAARAMAAWMSDDRNRSPTCYRHQDRPTFVQCTRCHRYICPECMRDAAVGHQCAECVGEGAKTVRQPRTQFGGRMGSATPFLTYALIAINVVAFIAQMASPRPRRPVMWSPAVADGELYRMITSAFLHSGITHILFNMFALFVVGPPLEIWLGRLRFILLYRAERAGWFSADLSVLAAECADAGCVGSGVRFVRSHIRGGQEGQRRHPLGRHHDRDQPGDHVHRARRSAGRVTSEGC